MSVLSHPRFHDEAAAFEYLEGIVWANGVVCPHCGVVGGRVYKLEGVVHNTRKGERAGNVRHGLKKCGECRKQFTVKVGTVFEHARLPLHIMLQAVHLIMSSKKGISAHQLHRVLEISYKAAWFLAHRVREAMRSGDLAPFGSNGTMVEVDETYIGHQKGKPVKTGGGHKMKVLALVDRETGKVRSFTDPNLTAKDIHPILRENIAKEARLMTDEARLYWNVGKEFAEHNRVLHAGFEYVRKGQPEIHTNTVEGYFSIFKRGMRGIYQHCGEQHLHRYLAEFDFRYSNREALGCNDSDRANAALTGIVGKRLTYRTADIQA